MLLEKEQVINLIPQKAPFIMIGDLEDNSDISTTSTLNITSDNILVENGFFTEPGLVENIAQTAALRAGYVFSTMKAGGADIEPPVGFIGAIKNLEITKLPTVGDKIETTVTVQNQVFDITLIKGETFLNGELIASCEMKIFVQNSQQQSS